MMKKFHIAIVPVAIGLMVAAMTAGCSSHQDSGSDALAQQKANVMGAPAPAAVQAQIAADRAKQQAAIQQHNQQAQPGTPSGAAH
jgi:hypothetical protein